MNISGLTLSLYHLFFVFLPSSLLSLSLFLSLPPSKGTQGSHSWTTHLDAPYSQQLLHIQLHTEEK